MTQKDRINKSRSVSVEELNEVRDGVYVGDFVNENLEERQYVLLPSKLFSSSPDMIYSSNEGYVGKYLLTSAEYDIDFREELLGAVKERVEHLETNTEPTDEQHALLLALDETSDNKLQADIKERLQEIRPSENVQQVTDRLGQVLEHFGESV